MPFDTISAREALSIRTRRDGTERHATPLAQAVQLQRALHKAGIAVASDISGERNAELRARIGSSLASIAKGWDAMAARVQILRGRAAPGTLSPAERRAKLEAKRNKPQQSGPRVPSKESLS